MIKFKILKNEDKENSKIPALDVRGG